MAHCPEQLIGSLNSANEKVATTRKSANQNAAGKYCALKRTHTYIVKISKVELS